MVCPGRRESRAPPSGGKRRPVERVDWIEPARCGRIVTRARGGSMSPILIVVVFPGLPGADHHRARRPSSFRSRAPTSSSGLAGATTPSLPRGVPRPLLPFVDVIRYRHSLKEQRGRHPGAGLHHARQRAGRRGRRALPEGAEPRARLVRHLRLHCSRSSQLAQTNLRSEVGKIDLDRTFEERTNINTAGRHASSTRRRSRGASRCCATRSRTSRRPHDILAAMESRCAPSARSAP